MSKKITIVYVITGLGTGGAEIMLYNLLSALDKEAIRPIVISLSDEGPVASSLREQGITVYGMHLPQGKIPSFGLLWKIVKLVRRIQPDIIQGWMYHGNLAAQSVRLFSIRKIPVLWTIHHSIDHLAEEKPMTRRIIRMGRWFSRLPEKIIYVSAISRQQHASLGYFDRRSCVIHNGVDTRRFVPSQDHRAVVRDACQLPPDCLLIGLFARYHPVKGHAIFLQAAALLQQRRENVYFLLAGKNIDWNNSALEEMIKYANVKNINLVGERNDMPVLAAAPDILSLSSHSEAFPLVIAEAMSCEVPCVSTRVGDTALLIADTGRLVPAGNPEALADAWEDLIKLGPEARKQYGKQARARIVADYSIHSAVEKYEALYYALRK